MPSSETSLTTSMIARIRKRGGYARKLHGGKFQSGLPDIICCYRGHYISIEVKLPGKERNLTTLQAATLTQVAAAGGISRMYVSVVQVDRLLDAIDQLYERRERRGKQGG